MPRLVPSLAMTVRTQPVCIYPCHSEEVCKTDVGIRVPFFAKKRKTDCQGKTAGFD